MRRGILVVLAAGVMVSGCSSSGESGAATTLAVAPSSINVLPTALPATTSSTTPAPFTVPSTASTTSDVVDTGPLQTFVQGDVNDDQRAVADAVFASWQAWMTAVGDPTQENEHRLAETTTGGLLSSRREFIASSRAEGRFGTIDPARPPTLTVIEDSIEIGAESASAQVCWFNSGVTMQHSPDGDVVVDDSAALVGYSAKMTLIGGRWLLADWQRDEGLVTTCEDD